MGKKSTPKQTTTSKTENNPWAPAQDQLKDILSEAQKQYEATGGLDGNWIDKNFPDLTPEMKASLGNLASSGQLNQVADNINKITSSASTNVNNASSALSGMTSGGITGKQINDLASSLYDNELVDSQVTSLTDDAMLNYDKQVNALNQAAGATGNIGSSRAGVAQGVMAGETNKAIAKGTADITNAARSSAYNQALGTLQGNQQTNLSASGALGSLGMNQGQLQASNSDIYQKVLQNEATAANVWQSQAQGKADNDWFNATGAANGGWDNLSKYLQMVGAIGGMGGTSNSTGTSKTSGSSGGMFNSILGGVSTGAGLIGAGAQAGWWSDAAMKKNVKKTGKTKKGTNKYEWEWNKAGEEKGMKGKASGVLAQDVAKKNPEAVKKTPSGKLMVDYDKTDVKPKNSKAKKKK
ncbi:hypothetical protein [Lundtoftevirus Lu221]|uniref:DNA injection protein n=1 Tax=phage PKM.Lu.22.1 TaxID=3049197 RepID=A0AAF0KY84_9CAUD|nr:hypothetical protein [phage PKM.Lu.22.1]